MKKNHSHYISPKTVIRGNTAWDIAKHNIRKICDKPLIIGRSKWTEKIRIRIENDIKDIGLNTSQKNLKYDCCEIDLSLLEETFKDRKCNGIIAVGGGKVLDSGKLLGHRLDIPCITIPTSAATCAGWTALSNIYSPDGAFIKDIVLRECPELLIFDHNIVRTAPPRTLASGIADALAKWYESSITSANSNDGLVQQAVQMARVLRDQLLIDGAKAFYDSNSSEWIRISEACALTAGLIGGIGGANCRTSAAHAIHNGLTQIKVRNKSLHGELVSFGILTQLRLEETLGGNKLAKHSRKQLIKLITNLNIPITLKELGFDKGNIKSILSASIFSCNPNSEIHNLPFKVDPENILKSILYIDEEATTIKNNLFAERSNS